MRYFLAAFLVAATVPGASAASYKWEVRDSWHWLLRDGKAVACYDTDARRLYFRDGVAWSAGVAMPDAHHFGCDYKGGGGYFHNGKKCCRKDAIQAIESGITDESHKRHIVVIGDQGFRVSALDKIGQPDWAVVHAYDTSDWHVENSGFVKKAVYVLAPDGAVLHRQDNLDGLEIAIDRADPAYDPAKDPDLRKTVVGGLCLRSIGIGAGGAALLGVFLRYALPLLLSLFSRLSGPALSQDRLIEEILKRLEKKP